MVRKNSFALPAFIGLLVIAAGGFCLPSVAQSTQSTESLGDAARRIRAEKNKAKQRALQPVPTVEQTSPPAGKQPQQTAQPATRQPEQTAQPATRPPEKDRQAWRELYDRGEEAMSSADYVSAEKLFRESLAYAEQHNLGTERIADSSEELGWSLRAQRKYTEAEGFYRNALQMRRGLYPENDQAVAHAKAGLGITLVGRGQYAEAETVLLESLSAYHQQRQPNADLCPLSYPLDGLTMLYKSNHEYSKGERIYTEAFALMTGDRGTPCENFVSMLEHLAALYADDNQWDRVEKIQQGRAGLVLGMKGPRSEMYGDALYAMADTLQTRRRFEEAATAYAKAAEVFRQADPPAPSKLAQSLESQEINLQLAGKQEEAKQIHPAVRAALEQSHTEGRSGEMMSIRTRAIEARRNGNTEEESRLIAQEVAASQKLGPNEQIIALSDSAMIHQEQQKLPEAEAELKRVLELTIATTGALSHATANAHVQLGSFYARNRRLGEAEESYATALGLFGAHDTDEVKMVLATLGWIYVMDGKFDQAEPLYQRSMKLAEETHDDAALSRALQGLMFVYQKTKRMNDAEAAITRAMNLTAQLPKPMNRQWAGIAMTAASFYEQSGRPQQAEQLYGRLISFLEQEYGVESPGLKVVLDKLIALMKSQGRNGEAAQYQARRDKLPPMAAVPGMGQ